MTYETTCDVTGLKALAQTIREQMGEEGILLLRGGLASGKTTFVQTFAAVLGIREPVFSPTFSILHEYENRLFHYDIYQCGTDGFVKSGLIEKLDSRGYHLIEWAMSDFEALLGRLGIAYGTLDIEEKNDQRTYKVNIHAYA